MVLFQDNDLSYVIIVIIFYDASCHKYHQAALLGYSFMMVIVASCLTPILSLVNKHTELHCLSMSM